MSFYPPKVLRWSVTRATANREPRSRQSFRSLFAACNTLLWTGCRKPRPIIKIVLTDVSRERR